MRNLIKYLLLSLMLISTSKLFAQEKDYKSYTLFVYNFMKYIEWPEEVSKGDFVIGVYGDSPIVKELETLAATKKLKGRNIVVKKISTDAEALNCHLVYIIPSKSNVLKTLSETTKGKSVLIITERESLAKKGAHISFYVLDDVNLKFDVNKTVLEQNNLKISTTLINLGTVVG
jgi:hypothetical protein